MRLYGLKNCDTCRKALKAVPELELVDVRADGVPDAVLERALAEFGDALINTRSTTWRGMNDAARQAAPMAQLKAHPALMKRPLITVEDRFFLGWSSQIEADIKALL